MVEKYVPPGLISSFNCPHCGALAHQSWFKLFVMQFGNDGIPLQVIRDDYVQELNLGSYEPEYKEETLVFLNKISEGKIFISKVTDNKNYMQYERPLNNLAISECYSCKEFSVWTSGRMIFPSYENNIRPNSDMPDDVKSDFLEAARILDMSPRGSAALLRLCIQKVCKFLGEEGKNINADIASLVKKGLDQRIQKALDIVRVIGNEAVHPGQIDLKDDKETASNLFRLVNMIADVMISQPKSVDDLFQSLPETKRKEIAKRDA